MTEFHERDTTIQHLRLADGRGYLRLTHRPSGLFVDSYLSEEAVTHVASRLMKELKEKVQAMPGDNSP